MNCAEIQQLIHADADGELDLVRSLEVERHLKSCAGCAAEKNSIQTLRGLLRQGDFTYSAPNSLRDQIRMIGATDRQNRSRENPWIWKWLAVGATAFAVLTFILRPAGISSHDQLLTEAVAGHVRSLQANHLTDVESSDQHTVRPWFNGRIDFAPAVNDFADQGFPLVGGRLDYLEGRTVAALVYRHNKHFINAFVWPANKSSTAVLELYRGYSIVNFDAGGFHYCLVSDAEGKELMKLAGLLGGKPEGN